MDEVHGGEGGVESNNSGNAVPVGVLGVGGTTGSASGASPGCLWWCCNVKATERRNPCPKAGPRVRTQRTCMSGLWFRIDPPPSSTPFNTRSMCCPRT